MKLATFAAAYAITASVGVLGGCASDDVPAEGIVTAEASAERDPFVALHAGVKRLAGLPPFTAEAETLARTLAGLLARDDFDAYPIPRGRIRPLLFHVAHPPDPSSRARAVKQLTAELQLLPARLARLSGG